MSGYQLAVQKYVSGTNRQLPVDLVGSYVFDGDKIIATDEDLSGFVGTRIGTLVSLSDAEVATAGGADETVTPIGDAAASAENTVLEVASDVAVDITYDVRSIVLADSTSGDKAITTSSANPGQMIDISLVALGGGSSYTLAVVGGALTFNAAAEYARVVRTAGGTWVVLLLSGATIV